MTKKFRLYGIPEKIKSDKGGAFISKENTEFCKSKQAGNSKSRQYIQGSKIAKKIPSVKYSLLQYSKNRTNGPSCAPGDTGASQWRAKMREFNRIEFLSQLKGDLWRKKQVFEKKSHNAEKLKGDKFFLLRFFNFSEKISECQKR